MSAPFVHRFIPNSAPGISEAMLREIGLTDVEQIYEEIPEDLRFTGELSIPKDPATELEVAKRVKALLAKNRTTDDLLSFLGAGCWPHYVPALCDEIIGRSEFLTAYAGAEYTDHGRYQSTFEFQSMMGDLLAMDVVSAPVFDGYTACGDAAQMAYRATGRGELLVPKTIDPDRLATMKNYCDPWLEVKEVDSHPETGLLDLDDLKLKISARTAAVFIENPSYLGFIEPQCQEVANFAHEVGALFIACVNPISLGILKPPGEYGADIACGEGQPLGMHMSCGGATLGILACRDEERLIMVMPAFMVGLTNTAVEGERAYSRYTLYRRMHYELLDKAKAFTGTGAWLWGIAAAVYMALLGPHGMQQMGQSCMEKAHYAMSLLAEIKGVRAPILSSAHFNEFLVNYDDTGKTAAEVHQALLEHGILGGKDISPFFPQFGNSALYCVTEIHTKEDIDRLADALASATA